MKIKLLVSTRFKGPKKVGDIIDVSIKTGMRLADNGIGEIVDEAGDTDEDVVEDSSDPYANMKPKQLYELCVKQGLEVEAKQTPEYYKEKLRSIVVEEKPEVNE